MSMSPTKFECDERVSWPCLEREASRAGDTIYINELI